MKTCQLFSKSWAVIVSLLLIVAVAACSSDGSSGGGTGGNTAPPDVGPGVGSKFPIATTTGQEGAIAASFDGENFLVAVGTHVPAGGFSFGAQFVDTSGSLVGSLVSGDGQGGFPYVAFDGANHLLLGANDETGVLKGWRITPEGSTTAFEIATSVGSIHGLAFGGGS